MKSVCECVRKRWRGRGREWKRERERERRGAHVQSIHADCSPAHWYYRVSPRLLPPLSLSPRPSSRVFPDGQLSSERLVKRTLEGTKPTSPRWNRNCWTQLIFLLPPFFFLPFSVFCSGARAPLSLLQEPSLLFDVSPYFLKG